MSAIAILASLRPRLLQGLAPRSAAVVHAAPGPWPPNPTPGEKSLGHVPYHFDMSVVFFACAFPMVLRVAKSGNLKTIISYLEGIPTVPQVDVICPVPYLPGPAGGEAIADLLLGVTASLSRKITQHNDDVGCAPLLPNSRPLPPLSLDYRPRRPE